MAINRIHGGIWAALRAVLLLSGCGSSPVADATSISTTVAQDGVASSTSTSADVSSGEDVAEQGPVLDEIDWQIDWDRVGPVQVGSTFEEIADAVGPGFEIADAGTLGEGLGGYSVSLNESWTRIGVVCR